MPKVIIAIDAIANNQKREVFENRASNQFVLFAIAGITYLFVLLIIIQTSITKTTAHI